MRTTIELPDELLEAAKTNAAIAGISLRQFFVEAVRQKLAPSRTKMRTEPPVIGATSDVPIPVLSGAELDEALSG